MIKFVVIYITLGRKMPLKDSSVPTFILLAQYLLSSALNFFLLLL